MQRTLRLRFSTDMASYDVSTGPYVAALRKPLQRLLVRGGGDTDDGGDEEDAVLGRGFHSSTFQLNPSRF